MNDALRQQFLEGMSYAAATVSIVATDGPAGRAGVTISAMASVTAEGPALLVCIHHKSPACQAVLDNGVFTLNVLRESQTAVSDTFAGRVPAEGGDKFAAGRWRTAPGGVPRLDDALVSFACRLTHSVEVGTHHVIFGAVEDIALGEGDRALVYANRAYGAAAPLLPPPPPPSAATARLTVAAFAPVAPYVTPAIVARLAAEAPDTEVRLREGDDDAVRAALADGGAEIALLYDFRLGAEVARVPLTALEPYALLPASHPLAHQDAVSLADLAAEPLVVIDIPPSRDYALSLFEAAGLTPQVGWHAGSFETARGLVGHGLGVAILATKPANALTYDGRALAARPLRDRAQKSALVAAYRGDAPLSPAAQCFLSAACAHFGIAPPPTPSQADDQDDGS
ncbi:MAG: hypothetical protein AcusKO_23880 [Acuticoccus sp.]